MNGESMTDQIGTSFVVERLEAESGYVQRECENPEHRHLVQVVKLSLVGKWWMGAQDQVTVYLSPHQFAALCQAGPSLVWAAPPPNPPTLGRIA